MPDGCYDARSSKTKSAGGSRQSATGGEFHQNTLHALGELLAAAGLQHPDDLHTHHIARRMSSTQVTLLSTIFPSMPAGSLLRGEMPTRVFQVGWPMASSDRFSPNEDLGASWAKVKPSTEAVTL